MTVIYYMKIVSNHYALTNREVNMGNHSDKISSKEITFLRMHTIFEKKEIKDFYKDFLKNWPDGNMDLKTFKEFLHGFFQENVENFAEHYFRNIDKDKTGKINFREFLLYMSAEGSTNPYDRITWLFDLFDINGNGSIDRKEMKDIFKCALKMTKEDVDVDSDAEKITADIFEHYDKNKNNSLTKQEFENAFLEEPQSFIRFPVLYNAIFNIRIQ